MYILVLNAGSSSLKYQLFDMEKKTLLLKWNVERIGNAASLIKHTDKDGKKHTIDGHLADHTSALHTVLDLLVDPELGAIHSLSEIQAVWHRVVHGWETFSKATIIDEAVKETIKALIPLAPLHNPANLMGIEACEKVLPWVPNVAVFDTAFFQSMSPEHYLYALPYEWYTENKVRKYGFHGTSHQYIAERYAELTGNTEAKIISCHVGNGASVAAISDGRAVDVSLGLTTIVGLIMGTRCGDIDPGIIPYIMRERKFSVDELDNALTKKSGLLGLFGKSGDHRDIEEGYIQGKPQEVMILNMYTNGILKYIATYAAYLQGADAIIFTAGVLENSAVQRKLIAEKLGWMGAEFDPSKNDFRGEERKISTDDSKVEIRTIPTNEELMIARQTYDLVKDL